MDREFTERWRAGWDNPLYEADDSEYLDCGHFDVTCPKTLAEAIAMALLAIGVGHIEILPAKAYFDPRYAG